MRPNALHGGPAATAALQQYVQALPDGPVQQGARMFVSPLVPRPGRWPWLAGALDALGDARSGLRDEELIDALAEALVDAPSALQGQALERLGTVGAGARAEGLRSASGREIADACTRAIEAWLASLAPHWRHSALVQIAAWPRPGSADRIAAAWTAQDIAELRAAGPPTAAAGALLAQVEGRQGSGQPEAEAAFDGPLTAADVVGDDLARARRLARWSETEAPTPRQRLVMAELARRIGDPGLRALAIRRLASHAGDAWIARSARAADVLAALPAPAEAVRRLVRLARRQPSRQRERSLDAAEARVHAVPDPGRRVLAAVDLVLASPLRLRWFFADVLPAADEDTRVAALTRLLAEGDDADFADTLACASQGLAAHRLWPLLRNAAGRRPFGPAACAALLERAAATACGAARGTLLTLAVAGLEAEGAGDAAWAVAAGIETEHGWLDAAVALTRRWPASFTAERAVQAGARLAALGHAASTLRLLLALLPAWPADAWAACVPALQALRDETMRTTALIGAFDAAAARSAGRPALEPLLTLARALGEARLRCIALGRAARCGPDDRLLAEALREGDRCPHARLRLQAWIRIAADRSPLPERLWERLLDELDLQPMAALQAAAQRAAGIDEGQAAALFDALPWARLQGRPQDVADVLCVLLPRLAPAERAQAIRRLPEACPGLAGVRCLGALGHAIEGEACEEAALQAAGALRGTAMAAAALLAITPRLGPARQVRALAWLAATPHEAERVRRLSSVSTGLHAEARPHWQAAVDTVTAPAFVRVLRAPARAEADAGPDPAALTRLADEAIAELLESLPPGGGEDEARATAGWLGGPARGLDALVDRVQRIEAMADRVVQIERSLPTMAIDERLGLIAALPQLLEPNLAERLRCQVAATLQPQHLGPLMADTASRWAEASFAGRLHAVPGLLDASFRAPWLAALRAVLVQASQGRDRSGLLEACRLWAPVLVAVGGEAAAREWVRAVADAGRLWP